MKMNLAKPVSVIMALLLAAVGGISSGVLAAEPSSSLVAKAVVKKLDTKVSLSTADHTKFTVLQQAFKTGPEVTKACLSCHTEASLQVHKTYHWTWESSGGSQKGLGKKNVLNNF